MVKLLVSNPMKKPTTFGELDAMLKRIGFARIDQPANFVYRLEPGGLVYALRLHEPFDPVRESDWVSLRHQLEWNGLIVDDDNPNDQPRVP